MMGEVRIDMVFDRRLGEFEVLTRLTVGAEERVYVDHGSTRRAAVMRAIARLRRNGHGGKRFTYSDGETRMGGIIPRPKPRQQEV